MHILSFDPYRGMGLAQQFVKPEHWLRELHAVRAADMLLYPESWQLNGLHYVLGKQIFPNPANNHVVEPYQLIDHAKCALQFPTPCRKR